MSKRVKRDLYDLSEDDFESKYFDQPSQPPPPSSPPPNRMGNFSKASSLSYSEMREKSRKILKEEIDKLSIREADLHQELIEIRKKKRALLKEYGPING